MTNKPTSSNYWYLVFEKRIENGYVKVCVNSIFRLTNGVLHFTLLAVLSGVSCTCIGGGISGIRVENRICLRKPGESDDYKDFTENYKEGLH